MNQLIIIFAGIAFVSVLYAWWSMRDWGVPKEVKRMLGKKRVKGSIVFFKGKKIKHYSSSSSSSSV